MNRDFSDELISAYLDGELTSEEQARVEQQLMDSAEHRKMFAELRALRGSLQALPSYRLDDDFAERVLKRAERAMLASSDEPSPPGDPPARDAVDQAIAAPEQVAPEKVAVRPAVGTNQAHAADGRGAIWVAIAAAAAVVVVAVLIFPPYRAEVAKNTENRRGDQSSAASRKEEPSTVDRSVQSSDVPAVELQTAPATSAMARKAGESPADKTNSARKSLANEPSAATAAPPENTLGEDAAERVTADGLSRQRNKLADNLALDAVSESSSFQIESNQHRGAAMQSPVVQGPIVQVTISQSAADQGVLEEILRKNDIFFDDESAVLVGQRLQATDKTLREAAPNDFADTPAPHPTKEPAPNKAGRGLERQAGEMVWIVASADQVEGLLHDLRQMPKEQLVFNSMYAAAAPNALLNDNQQINDRRIRGSDGGVGIGGAGFEGVSGFGGAAPNVAGGELRRFSEERLREGDAADKPAPAAPPMPTAPLAELSPAARPAAPGLPSSETDEKAAARPDTARPVADAESGNRAGDAKPGATRSAVTSSGVAKSAPSKSDVAKSDVAAKGEALKDADAKADAAAPPAADPAGIKRALAEADKPVDEAKSKELGAEAPDVSELAGVNRSALSRGRAVRVPFPRLQLQDRLEGEEFERLRQLAIETPGGAGGPPAQSTTSPTEQKSFAPREPGEEKAEAKPSSAKPELAARREQSAKERRDALGALDGARGNGAQQAGGQENGDAQHAGKPNGIGLKGPGDQERELRETELLAKKQTSSNVQVGIAIVIRIMPDPPVTLSAPQAGPPADAPAAQAPAKPAPKAPAAPDK